LFIERNPLTAKNQTLRQRFPTSARIPWGHEKCLFYWQEIGLFITLLRHFCFLLQWIINSIARFFQACLTILITGVNI